MNDEQRQLIRGAIIAAWSRELQNASYEELMEPKNIADDFIDQIDHGYRPAAFAGDPIPERVPFRLQFAPET